MLNEGCVKLLRHAGRFVRTAEPSSDDQTYSIELRDGDTAFYHDAFWEWHFDRLDGDPTLSPEEYWQRREEIEDGRFRFAWRRLMCHAVDPSVFAALPALPEAGHDRHQGNHLRRYAARLGNEWAIAVAERFENEIWDRN